MSYARAYVQVPLGGLPINLIMEGSGCIAFVKTAPFRGIIESGSPYDEVALDFFEDIITLTTPTTEQELAYDTRYNYKQLPALGAWLQKQNLSNPFENRGWQNF